MGSASSPTRIFGPCRSCKIPIEILSFSETLRMRAIRSACCSCVPCEKFIRATFIPARISFSIISSPWQAGPIVATIFTLRDIRLPTLLHIQHITNGGQCPIDRVFIDDQRRCKTDDIVVGFFGEDALFLHRFTESRSEE